MRNQVLFLAAFVAAVMVAMISAVSITTVWAVSSPAGQ